MLGDSSFRPGRSLSERTKECCESFHLLPSKDLSNIRTRPGEILADAALDRSEPGGKKPEKSRSSLGSLAARRERECGEGLILAVE